MVSRARPGSARHCSGRWKEKTPDQQAAVGKQRIRDPFARHSRDATESESKNEHQRQRLQHRPREPENRLLVADADAMLRERPEGSWWCRSVRRATRAPGPRQDDGSLRVEPAWEPGTALAHAPPCLALPGSPRCCSGARLVPETRGSHRGCYRFYRVLQGSTCFYRGLLPSTGALPELQPALRVLPGHAAVLPDSPDSDPPTREPGRTEPSGRTEPCRTESCRTEPCRTEPCRTEPCRTLKPVEPSRTQSNLFFNSNR